ncbi:M20/M25/M40 family metallo-hydrolase [Natronosalvus rutilus]|uniref:M20/M25/M40 family metallo-hydrolase n=1 Tax=Natronosalvus rutilus TaxID=2953753 RepID=A0A9E7SWP6_9EURY|nr:M20/M25/M40 family metallo-hydrolase [Natronosalvus rutilus]UTF54266.1 M20/M25/M40 family metallo-hydrolase [Natronosalvus rutilus]
MNFSIWDDDLREFVDTCCSFETTAGNEKPAQVWLREELEAAGFRTYTWEADPVVLAEHPSFPDDPDDIETADRPSVAGVLEFGDPDAGPTLVLNGHVDVVPTGSGWEGDPFEPRWRDGRLTARGAADMKSGLGVCVFAARHLAEGATNNGHGPDLNGRIVVESVVGEEEGGIGAAAAALENPYPFERDAMIVAEPTELRPVTAVEGSLMIRIGLEGRSAHAATRWRGASVLPAFERVREECEAFERERSEAVSHPLYDEFPIPWPICIGRVEAGRWASSVPDELTAEVRVGVAPGETVTDVEHALRSRLESLSDDPSWPAGVSGPTIERFSVQFEPAEIAADEPVVSALQDAMAARGFDAEAIEPCGATYGADNRHYIEAGIPTILFGPGSIDQAHFPEETIEWNEVLEAGAIIAKAARAYLSQ